MLGFDICPITGALRLPAPWGQLAAPSGTLPSLVFDAGRGVYAARVDTRLQRRSLNQIADFTRAGTATVLDPEGFLQTSGVDVPRFPHNAAGARLGLQVETGATNAILHARDLSAASWDVSDAAGAVSLTATGIDGAANAATRWIEDTSTPSEARFARLPSGLSFVSGTQYVFSAVAEQIGARHLELLFLSAAFGGTIRGAFDLTTGAAQVIGAGTNTAAGILPLGGGRYLCWLTAQATATASVPVQIRISTDPTSAATAYTGDGTSGLILDGVQVETGFRPTSRIFTSGSTVTRARDECSVTDLSWLGSGAGTVVFRGVVNRPISNAWRLRVDSNNFIGINVGSTGGLQLQQFRAGSTDGFMAFGDITFGVPFAVAVAWGGGAFSGSFNGASVITNSYSDLIDPTGGTLWIGSRQADLGQINGTIGLLSHYPSKLPDADLQALTA